MTITNMPLWDVIVLGAGAAGLMCAAEAGQRGCRVLVLDHADKAGAKILISGGGRCNFTNLHAHHRCFLSENPHFMRSALARYTAQDFIRLVESYGIAYHEKTLGQLFCDGSARQIVSLLLDRCSQATAFGGSVDVKLSTSVQSLQSLESRFLVETTAGSFQAHQLVVATGGPSIPKMGATGFAYDIAKQFGLRVVTPRPALVPLTVDPHHLTICQVLAGVSVPAVGHLGPTMFRENLLFTHRGLSGPVVLQLSSYWREGQALRFHLCPDVLWDHVLLQAKRERPKAKLRSVLSHFLPDRFADLFAQDGPQVCLADCSDALLRQQASRLLSWEMTPSGTEGYAKAEVTAGGVSTDDLSSKTMEAKSVTGLFFIGEAVDVTGWLGGYNFQWAWSSAYVAAQHLRRI